MKTLRRIFLGTLIFVLYRLLSWSWRIELREPSEFLSAVADEKTPALMAHWHGDELALIQFARRYKIATIASMSSDGELMSFVLRLLGARTSRGSSSRGAVQGLKGLFRLLKSGCNASFAVDGPKGPLHKVKPGVFEVSRQLGAPIFWAGVACDRAWRFEKSWNKTYLPKPFAKLVVEWRGPFTGLESGADPRSAEIAQKLEALLDDAHNKAEADIAAVRG